VGGSGLIVVVIVAAWALFLVPQWMHRRASAAQHLADRIPSTEGEGDVDTPVRRFGRRELSRSPRATDEGGGRFSRWHLPALPSLTRRSAGPEDDAATTPDLPTTSALPSSRSAAARRRRVLTVLALATLLTAAVVGVASLADLPVPAWLVAVPGGLMVAYLLLLAVVRPGTHSAAPAEPLRQAGDHLPVENAASADEAPVVPPLETSEAPPVSAETPVAAGSDSTWTPVPLPTPTYVTAPRARSVRTIDLSNPGSWTAAPAAASAMAAPSVMAHHEADEGDAEQLGDYLLEHRRAVGD
jgi:hypothetical protein